MKSLELPTVLRRSKEPKSRGGHGCKTDVDAKVAVVIKVIVGVKVGVGIKVDVGVKVSVDVKMEQWTPCICWSKVIDRNV